MADGLFSGGAAFGNPNLARQVARTRELQAARSYDVNTLPDPQTYAFTQGFFGESPDQLGFSILHPDYAKIIGRGEQGMLSGGVSMIGPTAQAIKGLGGIGVRTLGPTAVRMGEGYLQRQGLMPGVLPNFPTSITNRSEIKNLANDFADQFKQMGFDVTVDHSGSKAGASSYLRVSDPQTGRFLNKPIRISDHSKGAKELDANINVLNPQEDFAKITSALNDMRAKGDTLVFKQDRYAQELIASGVKPKTAYQRARVEITENQPSPYPQQAALDLAQQRAALPPAKGGLGLPANNTPEQRAKAMGFNTDAYHATDADIIKFDSAKLGTNTSQNTGGDQEAVESAMRGHWFSDRDLTNKDPRGYMFGDVSYPVKLSKPKKINDKEFGSTSYIVKDPDNIRSRFAAYDPFRRNAAIAAAMGVAAPDLLAGQSNEMPEAVRQYMANPMYSDPFADTTR